MPPVGAQRRGSAIYSAPSRRVSGCSQRSVSVRRSTTVRMPSPSSAAFARFDGAAALRRDAAEIARIVELFEFQPLDLHTPYIVRAGALFVKHAASSAREKRKSDG